MGKENLFSKHFTPDEADGWIPQLRELFGTIHDILEGVQGSVHALGASVEHRGNGGGIDTTTYFSRDRELDGALGRIQNAGIVIQDIGRGLVDFPTMYDGAEVFLCWELGDGDRLEWYHAVDAGYRGRKPFPR